MQTVQHIKPIRADGDLQEASDRVFTLSEKAEHTSLTREEKDTLDILLVLIEDYERKHGYKLEDARTPLERLGSLMEEEGMNANELGKLLGHRQLGSAILRGERNLSKTHIKILSQHFHVSPECFF